MQTIAILAQKGGTGKTTLAIHLAAEAERRGKPAAIIDIDPQASATHWSDARDGAGPAVVACPASRIKPTIQAAISNGVEWIFIDTAPHSTAESMDAVRAADLVLIPTRPGILDLRAISASVDMAKLAGKPAYVIVNAAPPRGGQAAEALQAVADQYGVHTCPVVIAQRAVYGHAITASQAAQEFEPSGKAAEEIAALWGWMASTLKQPAAKARKRA